MKTMKMMNTLIAASLITGSFYSAPLFSAGIEIPTDLSQREKPATIKVLLGKQKEKILLEAKGRFHVYNPLN